MKVRTTNFGRRPSRALMIACVALGAVLYAELEEGLFAPPSSLAVSPPARPLEDRAIPADFDFPSYESFHEVVERPLFSPTRRPPAKVTPAQSKPKPTPKPKPQTARIERGLFSVLGIVISDDERVSLVRLKKSGETVRMAVGDVVEGWRVESIDRDCVTFRAGEVRDRVELPDLAEVEASSSRRVNRARTPSPRPPSRKVTPPAPRSTKLPAVPAAIRRP